MKSAYPKIFEPITIKRTTIKNRIAMTPMGTNCTADPFRNSVCLCMDQPFDGQDESGYAGQFSDSDQQ